jgi:DNA sulfur modification protein DndB
MELTKKTIVLPALRGILGDWVYYSSLMSASQVSEWIQPAKDIREAKSLDEVLQRDLNKRKHQIADYLLKTDSRFFNSIVVGVYGGIPEWIEFDIEEKINSLNVMHDKSITESMGLLVFNGDENMFAIDGQHRVAGIEIAINTDESESISKRVLTDDTFSVIFLAHIDDELGRKRTRKLFSDINKNAKPVAKSDKIVIDEEDISSIVTRRIFGEYKHFQNGNLINISSKSSVDKLDIKHFTNIDNLYTVCSILKKLYTKAKNTIDWDEQNVIKLKQINEDFFDFVINNITEYKIYFIDNSKDLEEFRKQNKYLLFRPIGISLLAKLYVHFRLNKKLEKLESQINNIGFVFPESSLNKVLWNKGKMEAKGVNQTLAFDICLYMLGEYQIEKEIELRERFRSITKDDLIDLPNKIL